MNTELDLDRVAQRIRDARKSRGLTLEQLGERIGLSTSYLSQIENAHANLHLRVLRDIAMALEVPMVALLQDDQQPEVSVVRRHERHTYTLASGATDSLLFSHQRLNLEVTVMDLPPGTDSGPPNMHEGDECSYVLRGGVRIHIGPSQWYDLSEGDIIYYRSHAPHRWENPFSEPAQVLITNTPPTF